MAEENKLCFQCECNPRDPGDFLCWSCKEEHWLCYDCGKRERNLPFRLCTPCYEASKNSVILVDGITPTATTSGTFSSGTTATATGWDDDDDDGGDDTCLLPGCTSPKCMETSSGRVHDFCCKTHAMEYIAMYGQPPQRRPTTPRKSQSRPVLLRLRKDQSTYKEITDHFKKEWVKVTPANPKPPEPIAIYATQNQILEKKFHRYAEQIRQHRKASNSGRFYHGTKIKCDLLSTDAYCNDPDCGVCGISVNGFDASRIGSNIPRFKRFGHGIYLAPNSSKCHDYTQGMTEYGYRAQLLCLVACGAKYELKCNDTTLRQPPTNFDCVYGRSGGTLNYDEIVVYDVDAVMPQYIIVYELDGIDKIAK